MTEETKTATTEQAVPQQNGGAELTVQDLAVIKQIIDISTQRGAFKANEMATIGTTYNKLEAFLNVVQAQQAAAQEAAAKEQGQEAPKGE